jgi:hypothetical protein
MLSLLKKLFCGAFLYILLAPSFVTFLGTASNQLVLFANSDQFPVMWNSYKVKSYKAYLNRQADSDDPGKAAEAQFDIDALVDQGYIDDTHCVMTSKTHLNLLADIIDFKTGTYSIGDELIYLGDWLGQFCFYVWAALLIRKIHAGENK